MAYATQAELEMAAGGLESLVQLTDDAGTGTLGTAVLAVAQSAADGWVDSYAQRRHATPFAAPVPARIRLLAAEATVYLLKRRRRMIAETDKIAHDERETWLRDLAKGLVSPGTDPVPAKSTAVVPAIVELDENVGISRESLKGFW